MSQRTGSSVKLQVACGSRSIKIAPAVRFYSKLWDPRKAINMNQGNERTRLNQERILVRTLPGNSVQHKNFCGAMRLRHVICCFVAENKP